MNESYEIKLTHRINGFLTSHKSCVPILAGDRNYHAGVGIAKAIMTVAGCPEFALEILQAAYLEVLEDVSLSAGGEEWPEWLTEVTAKFAKELTACDAEGDS